MSSLVIRRVASREASDKPYELVIREADMAETTYDHVCYLDIETAMRMVECGGPTWQNGPPTANEIRRLGITLELREMKERKDKLEAELITLGD